MTERANNSKSHLATRALAGVGVGAMMFFGARFLIDFFGSALPYSMPDKNTAALDSEDFIQFLSLVTDGTRRHSRISRLKNGVEFYPAYLESIRRAKFAINLEFYEFKEGRVGNEILAALTERAAAGVDVRIIVDALGSFGTRSAYFDSLRAAGGQMCWYHPLRWNTWPKANNRTHRKLLIVDGETGFIGGAGIADHWQYETSVPVWRDTVFCVEGEAVAGLISAFCENWLESSGEILSSSKQFGFRSTPCEKNPSVICIAMRGDSVQRGLNVVSAQAHVGLWRDNNHVLTGILADVDQRQARPDLWIMAHAATVNALMGKRLHIGVAMRVGAHPADHRHLCPLSCCGDGLVAAFPAKKLTENLCQAASLRVQADGLPARPNQQSGCPSRRLVPSPSSSLSRYLRICL